MRPAAAWQLIPALVLLATPSAAYRFDVEAWQADWAGFADDFEDGVLPEGGPGEAPIYTPICGTVEEAGGALVLTGPDALCPAQPGAIVATTGGTTVGETRATFRFTPLALGQSYGVTLSDPTGGDVASLVLTRNAIPGFAPDALLVALVADPFTGGAPTPIGFAALSLVPPHDTISPAAIELRLSSAPGGAGALPVGEYRLCASSPCEDEATTPFQGLAPAPGALDGGALSLALAHGPTLVAFSPDGDLTVEVEEWRTRGGIGDDFESAAFAEAAPYSFSCGSAADVEQASGVLSLAGPVEPCGGNGLAFVAGLPGPTTISARFAFAVPGRCEAYGISAGPGTGDFAYLGVVRSEDPLDPEGGGEALTVRLSSEPEPGGPASPTVAAARLSGDPLGDPALADVVTIELELALVDDVAGLVPSGRFRLCTDIGSGGMLCPLDWTPLEPGVPAAAPDALLCGLPAASYDPPADGLGALAWEGVVGASLIATRVPEPDAGAAALAAALALGALRAHPRSRRRRRCPTKT